MKLRFQRLVSICMALAILLGCSLTTLGKTSAQAAEDKRPVLNVGTNAEFPPFEYMNDDGVPDGFDIAVIKAIGEEEGFDVKITNMEFKSLIASLSTGSLDAVIAGMTVTPERQQSVDFSDSYYTATQSIIVTKDSDIKSADDLVGKTVAVQEGTTGDLICSEIEDCTVKRFKKGADAVMTLKNGAVDAVMIDDNPAKQFVAQDPNTLTAFADTTSTEEYAIAVPKGDEELLDKINDGLQKIRDNGTFDKLVAEYIGDGEEEQTEETGEKPVLNVGTNAEFPPFEYMNDEGVPDGFDMAVIKAIGEEEGFDVKITNMEFKSLIASLSTGSLDAVIAGMTVTPERQQSVDFSDSYYTATQSIIVTKDSDIKSADDLVGKKVAVQEGTTGDLICSEIEDCQVERYKKGTDAVVTLKNGAVDAVMIDDNPAKQFVKQDPDTLTAFADTTSTEEYAIAVQKGDKELLDKINDGLQKIRDNGTFDALVAQYIGDGEESAAADGGKTVLNVGTNAEFPPFEYMDDNGQPDGFDIAVIKAIGEKQGFDVKITNMEFKSLIASLSTGGVDAVIAGMTVTPERQESVDFSDSYYTATQSIIVQKDSDIKTADDLAGKKVAVQEGTTGDLICSEIEGCTVDRYKKGADAVMTLKNDAVDAVMIDSSPADNFVAANNGELVAYPDETSTEEYAIAVQKGNEELLAKINEGLKQIQEDGTFDALVTEYIDQDDTGAEEQASTNPFSRFIDNVKYVFVDTNGYQLMAKGLGVTLGISVLAGILGIILGFILALMKLTEVRRKRKTVLSRIASIYIDIIRGTPMVVQLLIMYMVIFRSHFSIVAAVLSFGLNSGAYVAENIRAGILAVDAGQMEGGRSLGLTYGETMRYIILPQAIKNVIPALGNEMITLVKETSIVGYVAIVDLTKAGDFIVSRTYQTFLPLIATAIVYYIIVKIMTKILAVIERRLRQSDNR